MKKSLLIFLCFVSNLTFGQTIYQKDFAELWNNVNENYAYLQQQNIDWPKVKEIFQPIVDTIKTRDQFISFLEIVLYQLYNGHTSLNTNLESSNRLVPSGADLYVEKINNKYIVTDLRKGFPAEKCGIKTGMEIIQFNNKNVAEQLNQFLPKYTNNHTPKMVQFAIDMLFAGTHDIPRKITVLDNGIQKDFYPDKIKITDDKKLLETKLLNKNVGYIKINNSLYDYNLINAFDKAVDSFNTTQSIIIDLTETPSGGNTTVARSIMGRFIDKKLPYQQHEIDELEFNTKQYWIEYVLPRKPIYTGNVIVLVGHWTGSMGEGIAIGFDGMKRATIIGTAMAGLLGAINSFTLTETKIGYQFPTERLYHINGTPREDYKPTIQTGNIGQTWEQVQKILNFK
ncbi:MAG: S41 family peptidase [Bacteroidota bacterium]